MPMNRNVQDNRVCEDWTVTFLQSVLHQICWGLKPVGISFSTIGLKRMKLKSQEFYMNKWT